MTEPKRVRFGYVLRTFFSGKHEKLFSDVSESRAEEYLAGPDALHSRFPADTFDHFVAERWGYECEACKDSALAE